MPGLMAAMTEDLSHLPLVIGAGPAGLAAAETFVNAGIRPVVMDEAQRPGGQGTRRLSPRMQPLRERLFGAASAAAMAEREAREDTILAACDFRPGVIAWGAIGDEIALMVDGRLGSVRRGNVVVATGAMDRIFPVPGWTLPGVYALGGAQVALKRDASGIGRQVVFAGSSPLLYLAAVQYLRAGCGVAAVLDTTPFASKMRAVPGMLAGSARTLLDGARLILELRRARVPVEMGVTLEEIVGDERVAAIAYRDAGGAARQLHCDAVGLGFGLRSEAQLAELLGADFRYDAAFRQWFPITDSDGRAGPRLWLAGDGAQIGGAAAAACAGKLAALSVLAEIGGPVSSSAIERLRRRLVRWQRFQRAMTEAFATPIDSASRLPDSTVLCRCERVSFGEVRQAIAATQGPIEVNRVKAITRCGMGRCQGRLCNAALAELTAQATGQDLERVGRLRAQAPIRPIPASAALAQDAGSR